MTRIGLKHVNAFRDRHGQVRHYFRRPGCKSVPLPGLPGSAEFMQAYRAALVGKTAPSLEISALRIGSGTLNAINCSPTSSSPFKNLPQKPGALGEIFSKKSAWCMAISACFASTNAASA